jgi:carbon monoxide dehydrogenase subunit G
MASIRREILTAARPADVWAAISDIGALHTRLVPGFVVDTRLEPGARMVTFGDGREVRELIIDLDEDAHRVVWSAAGGRLTHHNASVQVYPAADNGSRVVWVADLLPDNMKAAIEGMIAQGMTVMKTTLDRLAGSG